MQDIYQQLLCLSIFTITGIVIGILFDVFRIMRKSFKTIDLITYLQDILFWILTGIIVLFSIFKFNNGEIRAYVFFGILLGILLYIVTISKYIIKYSVIIIKYVKKIIIYPAHLLINFLKKVIVLPIKNLIEKIKKTKKNIHKKVTFMTKNNKKISKKEINLKEKGGIL